MFTINDYINECLYAINDNDYFIEKNLIMNQIVEAIWHDFINDLMHDSNDESNINNYLKNDILYYLLINDNSDSNFKNDLNFDNLIDFCNNKIKNEYIVNYLSKLHEYNFLFNDTKLISNDNLNNEYKSKIFGQNIVENCFFLKKFLTNDQVNLKYHFIVSIILNKCRQYVPNFSKILGVFPYYNEIVLINKKIQGFNDYMHQFGSESFIINPTKIKNKDSIHYVFKSTSNEVNEYFLIYDTYHDNKNYLSDFLNIKDGYIEIFGIIIQVIRAMYVAHKECKFTHGDLNLNNVSIIKLKDDLYIQEYDEISNIAKKYNINYKYQKVNMIASIMDYSLSQINLEKVYNINDENDTVINVNRINKYLYKIINEFTTALHDVFKYILYINMFIHKYEFNEKLNEIIIENISKLKTLIKDVLLNFFFTDVVSNKELEYLYLCIYDENDEYKTNKKIWNTFYTFPQNESHLDFIAFIDHIFKYLKNSNHINIIDSFLKTQSIPEKVYTKNFNLSKDKNKFDKLKFLDIIYENNNKVLKNLDEIIEYINFMNEYKRIHDAFIDSESNEHIDFDDLYIKLAVYYIYYILIYENLIKEYSYIIYTSNLKCNENIFISSKYIDFLIFIFNIMDNNYKFKECFNDYDLLKNHILTFFNN